MKRVILTALAVFSIGVASAQTARFGLKAGLNVSTLSGDIDNASPMIGVHGGGLVEIKITNKFAVQPELLLSLQGAKSDFSYVEPGYEYSSENKIHLAYLNIPVMAKFYVLPKLALEAGPQLGVLVSARNKYSEYENDGGAVTSFSRTEDVKNGLKTVEAAFDIGAAYYFTSNWYIEGRFCFGLSSIDENGGYYRVDNGNGYVYRYGGNKVTNNVFQASVGYRF